MQETTRDQDGASRPGQLAWARTGRRCGWRRCWPSSRCSTCTRPSRSCASASPTPVCCRTELRIHPEHLHAGLGGSGPVQGDKDDGDLRHRQRRAAAGARAPDRASPPTGRAGGGCRAWCSCARSSSRPGSCRASSSASCGPSCSTRRATGWSTSCLATVRAGGVAWLSNPNTALMSIIIANVWRGTAFSMILQYAGLQSIPDELYEAAEVDGANDAADLLVHNHPAAQADTHDQHHPDHDLDPQHLRHDPAAHGRRTGPGHGGALAAHLQRRSSASSAWPGVPCSR